MKKLISIATTAYNEELVIEDFVNEVRNSLSQTQCNFEIVICDNGSTDKTLEIVKRLRSSDERIRYVSLIRNFGHQGGILAAIDHSKGDAIVTMDADMQHPPSLIPSFIKKWQEGFLIINSIKSSSSSTLPRKIVDFLFYRLMDKWAGLKIGQADFRLIDREVVNCLLSSNEAEKFLRGLISWQGHRSASIEYSANERTKGVSKFSRRHLFDFAFQGITSFSTVPLRLILKVGWLLFIPSVIFNLFNLYIGLANMYSSKGTPFDLPPGWFSLGLAISMFGSLQLIFLGVMGEFLANIFLEVKQRPSYVLAQNTSTKDY